MASFTISDLVGGLEELAASPSGIVNLNKDLVLKRRFHDAVQTLLLRLGGADWMTQRLLYSVSWYFYIAGLL